MQRKYFLFGDSDKKGHFDVNSDNRCPRCGEENLRTWDELDDEERELVLRLPGSAEYEPAERQARHQWCMRCWFESTISPERAV